MIKTKNLILIVFVLCFSTYSFSQDLDFSVEEIKEKNGKPIKRIELKGLVNTNKELVISVIGLTKGDIFNHKKLQSVYNSLRKLGLFKQIELDADLEDGQVVIIFTFEELRKVGAISIEGEDEIDEKDIISVMSLKPGNVYQDSELLADEEKIRDLYKSKGFDGTSVQVRALKGRNKKLVNVKVIIQEGREVFIKSIKIIGTKNLDPDDIYDKMQSKETTLLRGGQVLDNQKLNMDKQLIVQYMKDNGYWKGKIVSTKIRKELVSSDEEDNQDKGYHVLIEVKEGPQYRMGKVTFTGQTIFKEKDFYAKLKPKKGEIYNDTQFRMSIAQIKDLYNTRGYINCRIIPNPNVDDKNLIINYEVEIIEGQKVHIESIKIYGNTKSKLYVIDRELTFWEGEIYNSKKIRQSFLNLRNTQFFGNVMPTIEPGTMDGLVNINFKVEEQRTGMITAGVGYGTSGGFSVFEEITEKNFFGTGWMIRERVEWGETKFSVEVGTGTKWLLPYVPILFNFTFRYSKSEWSAAYSIDESVYDDSVDYTYKRESFELDFMFGYKLSNYWTIYTGWLISFSKAYDPDNFTLADLDSDTVRGRILYEDLQSGQAGNFLSTVSHRIGYTFDTRDFHLNPRNGFRIKGEFTYTGGIYGGNSQWLKFSQNGSFYINPLWEFVFAFYAGCDIMFSQGDAWRGKTDFSIREWDRLRFDGLNELRGWNLTGNDEVVGQGGKISLSAELRFPIFGDVLWGVMFFDAGEVTDTLGSLPDHIGHYSYGGGFRLQIPMIPIRFYFAKLMEYSGGSFHTRNGIQVIFSVGGIF